MTIDTQAPLDPTIAGLWQQVRDQLHAQLQQRTPAAVFLEGSIAEGFGNPRSDVDFVAVIDDGLELPTMPYLLFIDGRRIEVRLLSSRRLGRELARVRQALEKGTVARLSWNLLERCQRFMGCLPLENPALIDRLQGELGRPALEEAVSLWFGDFARQSARHAVAMLALAQPDYARAWMVTAVFHAAKSFVARQGEPYMSPKWLSLQLKRAGVESPLVDRLWGFLHQGRRLEVTEQLQRGIDLLKAFGVKGVTLAPERVLVLRPRGVTTWQIGERVHLIRDRDIFALEGEAARVWRSITWNAPCATVAGSKGGEEAIRQRLGHLADFSRAGLLELGWRGGGRIRARQRPTSLPVTGQPLIGEDGAVPAGSGLRLLPMPAHRFVEAGLEVVWANIGLENAREDALGAQARGQWQVLEYALQRMVQTACLAALGAYGVTPQPPLEEAVLETLRLLPVDPTLGEEIRRLESTPIEDRAGSEVQFDRAGAIVARLHSLGSDNPFPASFDSAAGWRDTILQGYDWINLGAHLQVRFPQTAPGGHGSAEEARDLLASCG